MRFYILQLNIYAICDDLIIPIVEHVFYQNECICVFTMTVKNSMRYANVKKLVTSYNEFVFEENASFSTLWQPTAVTKVYIHMAEPIVPWYTLKRHT